MEFVGQRTRTCLDGHATAWTDLSLTSRQHGDITSWKVALDRSMNTLQKVRRALDMCDRTSDPPLSVAARPSSSGPSSGGRPMHYLLGVSVP